MFDWLKGVTGWMDGGFGDKEVAARNAACDVTGGYINRRNQTIAEAGGGFDQTANAWAGVDQRATCRDAMQYVPTTPMPGARPVNPRSASSWMKLLRQDGMRWVHNHFFGD